MYCTIWIRATSHNQTNEILIGRTNREDTFYDVVRYEGALLHLSCRRWSYYSGRRTNRSSTVFYLGP